MSISTSPAPTTAQTVVIRIVRSALRHWRRLLITTLVGAVLLGAFGFLSARGGSSTSTVFVAPLEASPFSPDPRGQTTTNLETEAQVAKSDEVLGRAAESVGEGVTASHLDQALSVAIPPGAQVLTLTVAGSTALDPKAAVDAIATSYLLVRQERTVESLAERKTAIAASRKIALAQLQRAAARIAATATGSAGRQVAEQELNVASGTLAALAQSEADLAAVATYPGEVLAPGSDPSPRAPLVPTVAGAFLGFLVGLGWALLIDRRTRKARRAEEPLPRVPTSV